MRIRFLLLLLFALLSYNSNATQDSVLLALFENLELDEEADLAEVSLLLEQLRAEPIAVNEASIHELRRLFFLTGLQINNLYNHIRVHGPIHNLLEIQTIEGFDPQLTYLLLPFLKLNKSNRTDLQRTVYPKSRLLVRHSFLLEQPGGYAPDNRKYAGDQHKLLLKYQMRSENKYALNVSLEKDAGEHYLSKQYKLPDFTSASLQLQNLGIIRKLVLGDYNLQFGQGLSIWTGFSLGKTADIMGMAKSGMGLVPYTSVNENNFFRGLALSANPLQNIQLTGFVSRKRFDAKIELDEWNNPYTNSIARTGLHRTPAEISNRSTLLNQAYGLTIQYNQRNLQLGATFQKSGFDIPFALGSQSYQQFNFTGKKLHNIGLSHTYTLRNLYFFGEISRSNASTALLQGVLISISPNISGSFLYRNYPKNFHNFTAGALGENTVNQNEQGLLIALNIQLLRRLKFSLYKDEFSFNWLKYRVHSPSKGNEWRLQLDYQPNRNNHFSIRYKASSKPQNLTNDIGTPPIVNYQSQNWRLQSKVKVGTYLQLGTAANLNFFDIDSQKEYGYALAQDIQVNGFNFWQSSIRVAYFHTSYNARVYSYEQNVLHGGGFTAYNGQGFRLYTNNKFKIDKKLSVWLRYAAFFFPKQETIGTGNEQIEGSKKQEMRWQFIYQF